MLTFCLAYYTHTPIHLVAAMWLANIVCVGMIQFWGRGAGVVSLGQIWWALAAFMGVQVVTGALRFSSMTGIWSILRAEKKKDATAS